MLKSHPVEAAPPKSDNEKLKFLNGLQNINPHALQISAVFAQNASESQKLEVETSD